MWRASREMTSDLPVSYEIIVDFISRTGNEIQLVSTAEVGVGGGDGSEAILRRACINLLVTSIIIE